MLIFFSKELPLQILTESQLLNNLEIRQFSLPKWDANDTESDNYWILMCDLILAILDIEPYIQKIICDIRFQEIHELWIESMQISLKIFSDVNFFKVFFKIKFVIF